MWYGILYYFPQSGRSDSPKKTVLYNPRRPLTTLIWTAGCKPDLACARGAPPPQRHLPRLRSRCPLPRLARAPRGSHRSRPPRGTVAAVAGAGTGSRPRPWADLPRSSGMSHWIHISPFQGHPRVRVARRLGPSVHEHRTAVPRLRPPQSPPQKLSPPTSRSSERRVRGRRW